MVHRATSILFQHRQSDHQQVLLQDASLHTSGQYKCEVSAEAPSFNSVSADAGMEVVGERTDAPTLSVPSTSTLRPGLLINDPLNARSSNRRNSSKASLVREFR